MRKPNPGKRARIAALAASAVVVSPLAVGTLSAQADEVTNLQLGETKTYIVQLADDPLVAFDGGHGLAATAPKAGEKVDADSSAAQAYTNYLDVQRAEVLETIGLSSSDVVTTYDVALNGFAVKMNAAEAIHMRKAPGVVQVWEDEIRHADTVQTPDYLGLSGEGGVWQTEFGGFQNAGDGVIVGVIDTGIDPLNPSFAEGDMPAPPEDWAGTCEGGTDSYAAFECNNKIIGAHWYGAEYGNTIIPEEFTSARDYNGHGSHTAGTSAGNHGVPLSVQGADLGFASGMAPAAHIAVYKALWMTSDGNGSGTTAGLVAAIDQAVEDGVDVINYSISGSSTYIVGADEVAFLFAADAGIFVSTSAGNSGDTVGVSSVAHNAPWTMTVAASTHNRGALNSVTLGNGETYEGVGYGGPLDSTPLVFAGDIAAEGGTDAALCAPGSVDDAGAAGKIVVCERGAYALVDKGTEVINSGGVGMVMINTVGGAGSQNAIIYGLPATHLNSTDGTAVKAYAQGDGAPTASISATENTIVNAPEMASFSSYGPALAGGGDLLKPDITGPGVDIAAAYHAKHGDPGTPTFDQISGTSMSAPHIAGLAALMKQEFPEWSPAAIKSAMMTTARDVDDNGDPIELLGDLASPLNYGAGEVQPAPSYNPGLVYDADTEDWISYTCAIGQWELAFSSPTCAEIPAVDASDLNYPSISIGDLAGQQTVTRTVTDVTGEGGTYAVNVQEPAGISVEAPETITVEANGTATFDLTFTVTTAAPEAWTFGQLRLVNGDITVESPIALRPLAIASPDEVSGEGTSGSLDYSITTGFTGTVITDVDGLIPSDVLPLEVTSDGPSGGPGFLDHVEPIVVPEGTKTLRISTFQSEITPADVDMDLFLINPAFTAVVAQSAAGGSNESITLQDPAPGTYNLALDYWDGAAGAVANVPTHVWAVSDTDEGNLTVTPDTFPAAIGQSVDLTLDWTGLATNSRYLGAVNFLSDAEEVGSTLVSVTTGADGGELAVERVAGKDRYATAAAISELYPEGADTVYVAYGEAFADALTGSAAAGAGMSTMTTPDGEAAPVLLVGKNIPTVTADALDALAPSNIVVLGGPASVSTDIETELTDWAPVNRIGGADRYETAALLAAEFGPGLETVYVASGLDAAFPDALAASALAGHEGVPVLLTRPGSVPATVAAALESLAPANVVVVGGPNSVSNDVYADLGADARLAGADRWETNVAITAAYAADAAQAYVASGLTWPDALTGAALAGSQGAPMLLTHEDALPGAIEAELNRLSPADVTIFGGLNSVSQNVEDELNALLPSWQ